MLACDVFCAHHHEVMKKFEATAWARKLKVRETRKNMGDFDRFKTYVAKKARSKAVKSDCIGKCVYTKKKYSLDNIIILPYQPRERIHLSLGSADILVVSLGEGSVGYTHPNKIYGAMFIGKPILYLGPQKSHVTDILEECDNNIAIQHGESNQLVEKLLAFGALTDTARETIGRINREYAEKHFHPSVLIGKMAEAIESLEKK